MLVRLSTSKWQSYAAVILAPLLVVATLSVVPRSESAESPSTGEQGMDDDTAVRELPQVSLLSSDLGGSGALPAWPANHTFESPVSPVSVAVTNGDFGSGPLSVGVPPANNDFLLHRTLLARRPRIRTSRQVTPRDGPSPARRRCSPTQRRAITPS